MDTSVIAFMLLKMGLLDDSAEAKEFAERLHGQPIPNNYIAVEEQLNSLIKDVSGHTD